jgi:hypothetical protein
MSTIVQKTAFTIVCGLERNFDMPKRKRMPFAVDLLNTILSEQGVQLDEKRLRREIYWADFKRRLRNLCPIGFRRNSAGNFLRGLLDSNPTRLRSAHP